MPLQLARHRNQKAKVVWSQAAWGEVRMLAGPPVPAARPGGCLQPLSLGKEGERVGVRVCASLSRAA